MVSLLWGEGGREGVGVGVRDEGGVMRGEGGVMRGEGGLMRGEGGVREGGVMREG